MGRDPLTLAGEGRGFFETGAREQRWRMREPVHGFTNRHEVRPRIAIDAELTPVNMQEAGEPVAAHGVALLHLELGLDEPFEDLIHGHVDAHGGATGHVSEQNDGPHALQQGRITQVAVEDRSGLVPPTIVTDGVVERRSGSELERAPVQGEEMNPGMDDLAQIRMVVADLVAVATATHDDAITGIHAMTFDTLENMGFAELIKARTEGGLIGEGEDRKQVNT